MQKKNTLGLKAAIATSFAVAMLIGNVCRSQTEVAEPEQATKFNIPPGDLATALRAFGEQSDTDVLFDPQIAVAKHTAGLTGKHATREGLRLLLAQANLEFRMLDGKTVLVEAAASAERTPSSAAGSTTERGTNEQGQGSDQRSDRKDASQDMQLEEIVVTAQKRRERLQDVPQSVSVLTSDDLAKLGATQFRDFANNVPGLSFSTAGAGNTRVVIRGVTTGFDVASTVGIYVDDVPYGSSSAFTANDQLALDVGLFDIDHIEVLRGPQGTLYGASTMGGLLKYATTQPDTGGWSTNLRTDVSHTERGSMSYNGSATVNVPIVTDKVALRASAFHSRDGGFIDNVARAREDANRAVIEGGRISLLFLPSDALSISISGFAQDISRDGEATSDFEFTGLPIDDSVEQRRRIAEVFEQRFRLGSATVTYDFGSLTLTSISSYQTTEADFVQDVSPGYVPLLSGPFLNLPVSAAGTRNVISTDKFTQEIRLAAERIGAFEWIVGGYYTDEKSTHPQSLMVLDLAGQPGPNIYDLDLPSRYEESAVFGDLTWYVNEKFDVTGGMRYAHNRQSNEQIASPTSMLVSSRLPGRSSEDVSTYLVNARYRFSDRFMLYLRYATGYRPGGPNYSFENPTTGEPIASEPFEADRLKSYEVGLKRETDDRRFGVNLAAYYIDWNNFQVAVIRGGFASKANAPGGATVRGLELSLTARPVRGFSASAALAYQDATMSEADESLQAAKGERLPNVPRFTGSLLADYSFDSIGRWEPSLGLTLRHVSDRQASFDDTQGFLQYDIPAYTVTDVRAGLDIGATRVQLYVRNVFDERAQVSVLNTWQGLARPAILQPRTVGVSLNVRF